MKTTMTASICWLLACAIPAIAQNDYRSYYPLKVKQRWTYVSSDPKAAQDPQKKDDAKKPATDPNKQLVIEVERAEEFIRKGMKDAKDEKFPGFILKMTSGDKVKRDHIAIMNDGAYRASLDGRALSPPVLIFKFV